MKYTKTIMTVVVVLVIVISGIFTLGGLFPKTSVKGADDDALEIRFKLGGIPLEDVKEYKSTSMPLSVRTATSWITLHETKVKVLPDKTLLGEILKSIKNAIRPDGFKINFIIDQTSLHVNEVSLESEITLPDAKLDNLSIHRYLTLVLESLNLAYTVHDNVILITFPVDDSPIPRIVSASEAHTWLLLNETVSFSLPDDTSLPRAIEVIQKATLAKSKIFGELRIQIDPKVLLVPIEENDPLLRMEFDDVPICTALGLILERSQLGFHVREDGFLIISKSASSEDDTIFDMSELAANYQLYRYSEFHTKRNACPRPPDVP